MTQNGKLVKVVVPSGAIWGPFKILFCLHGTVLGRISGRKFCTIKPRPEGMHTIKHNFVGESIFELCSLKVLFLTPFYSSTVRCTVLQLCMFSNL